MLNSIKLFFSTKNTVDVKSFLSAQAERRKAMLATQAEEFMMLRESQDELKQDYVVSELSSVSSNKNIIEQAHAALAVSESNLALLKGDK